MLYYILSVRLLLQYLCDIHCLSQKTQCTWKCSWYKKSPSIVQSQKCRLETLVDEWNDQAPKKRFWCGGLNMMDAKSEISANIKSYSFKACVLSCAVRFRPHWSITPMCWRLLQLPPFIPDRLSLFQLDIAWNTKLQVFQINVVILCRLNSETPAAHTPGASHRTTTPSSYSQLITLITSLQSNNNK